jgi:hypothetical protein
MNTDTGHLIALKDGEAPPDGYTPVPERLQGQAKELLEWAAMNRAERRRANGKNKKGFLH